MFLFIFFLETNVILYDDFSLMSPFQNEMYRYNISGSGMKYGSMTFGCEATITETFFVSGSMKALIGFPYESGCDLLGIDSAFRMGARWECFELGYRHDCNHPVYSFYQREGYHSVVQSEQCSRSEVYLKIEGKVEL
jgi:hypothetical protein